MLTNAEKIQRLQDCIALLDDVDAMQQTALADRRVDDYDVCEEFHIRIESLRDDLIDELTALEAA